MDRLISEQAALNAIAEFIKNKDSVAKLILNINAIPSAEQKTEKVIKMRDATPEERESIDKYIKSISKPTGVAFWDLEQEPKTGHWRAIYQGDEIIDYRCSECEFGSTFGKSTYRMNYCPNCGARMVEPQESEGKE